MSYVRKIVALILSVMFIAALIICAGVVFSLKNINVTYQNYSGIYAEKYEEVKNNLNALKGLNVFSVDKNDVSNAINSAQAEYIEIVSVERVYPCSINIVLKERVERFAMLSNGVYNIYDVEGNFIRTSSQDLNNVDSSPNVLIYGADNEEEIKFVSNAVSLFENSFKKVRTVLQSVSYPQDINAEFSELVFNLRSGLKISIIRPKDYLAEKMEEAFNTFNALTDSDKIQGKIRSFEVVGTVNGIRATYER